MIGFTLPTTVVIAPFKHGFRGPAPRCCVSSNTSKPPLILGLNQYSHDASVAIVSDDTGEILFAGSKERLTRRKHDGGAVGDLVRHALECVGGDDDPEETLNRVKRVVANGHHFGVRAHERRLAFLKEVGYVGGDLVDRWNLVGGDGKIELSHHLAHAYSAICIGGAKEGIVVVMDGMGQALREWEKEEGEGERDKLYVCDYDLEIDCRFLEWPKKKVPGRGYREAESAYLYKRHSNRRVELRRIYKRWTLERSPPELYNHGFENMESLGAIYSRIALHIFGDWNACGKVMGLAKVPRNRNTKSSKIPKLMSGNLLDGSFRVAWEVIDKLPHVNKWADTKYHEFYKELAGRVQEDLEEISLDFLTGLRAKYGSTNLVFCGGVALNSTLNGRIIREAGFGNIFIPPHPGDEGIALGCALYGYQQSLNSRDSTIRNERAERTAPQFTPYLGRDYSTKDITDAIHHFSDWIECEKCNLIATVAKELSEGKIVGWFNGRAEFGPRALGNRSLLADPRRQDMAGRLNIAVKKRETFRPFAPSVLHEAVSNNFAVREGHFSPYMSLTLRALYPQQVPAVVHTDRTSRLQSVRQEDNPEYYSLIKTFAQITSVPMILNTSFNIAGEPIVESPYDALHTFLRCPDIDLLAFPGIMVRRVNTAPSWKNAKDTKLVLNTGLYRSETIQNMTGEVLRISLQLAGNGPIEGQALELEDELELSLLQLISEQGEISLSQAVHEFSLAGEGETDESEIVEKLKILQKRRIIRVISSNEDNGTVP